MYLQGDLQIVFDALYEMGMIEPVLKMDWQSALSEISHDPSVLVQVIRVVNNHQVVGTHPKNDRQYSSADLAEKLENFDEKTLSYLAMEVAREYADFHSRNEVH